MRETYAEIIPCFSKYWTSMSFYIKVKFFIVSFISIKVILQQLSYKESMSIYCNSFQFSLKRFMNLMNMKSTRTLIYFFRFSRAAFTHMPHLKQKQLFNADETKCRISSKSMENLKGRWYEKCVIILQNGIMID